MARTNLETVMCLEFRSHCYSSRANLTRIFLTGTMPRKAVRSRYRPKSYFKEKKKKPVSLRRDCASNSKQSECRRSIYRLSFFCSQVLTSPPANDVILEESGGESADDDEAEHARDAAGAAQQAQPAPRAVQHVEAVDAVDSDDAAQSAHPDQHEHLQFSADHTYCAPAPPAMTEVRFQSRFVP